MPEPAVDDGACSPPRRRQPHGVALNPLSLSFGQLPFVRIAASLKRVPRRGARHVQHVVPVVHPDTPLRLQRTADDDGLRVRLVGGRRLLGALERGRPVPAEDEHDRHRAARHVELRPENLLHHRVHLLRPHHPAPRLDRSIGELPPVVPVQDARDDALRHHPAPEVVDDAGRERVQPKFAKFS